MEKKLVRVPFEVGMAKKITNGEIEGKIVTRSGKNVRIVCFDKKSVLNRYPILALIESDEGETSYQFNYKGYTNFVGLETKFDLLFEVPEYITFRDGDVISFGNTEDSLSVGIFHENKSEATHECYVIITKFEYLVFEANALTYNNARFATEEEKQKLINALKASDEQQAKDCLKRFFGIEEKKEYEFKPKDWILCRCGKSEWTLCQFSHIHKKMKKFISVNGIFWDIAIPYNEKTKHLLGTTEDYKEE